MAKTRIDNSDPYAQSIVGSLFYVLGFGTALGMMANNKDPEAPLFWLGLAAGFILMASGLDEINKSNKPDSELESATAHAANQAKKKGG